MRNGIEPWPGVPRTRSRRQATPFSPTVTPIAGCLRRAVVQAAALGQQVVAADRVGVVVGHPAGAVGAAGLLVGDGEVEQVARAAGTPRSASVAERHGHRRREVEHVDRAAAPHLVDPSAS